MFDRLDLGWAIRSTLLSEPAQPWPPARPRWGFLGPTPGPSTHKVSPTPPNPEMMAKMGALIEEGMKSGWLIATEGVSFSDKPVKVRSRGGKLTVSVGPFAEAKEVLGGYAIMEARDREHVLELTRKFLAVAGDGTCEIHELFAPPT